MKFTCEKALLVSALSVASRTVAQKSTIPCLEGVLLRAGVALQLTGYNLETGITVHVGAQIQEAGSCVMPARLFFDIVRKLPDEMVSITVDHKQQVSIRAGAAFFQITAMDSEDYPELPDVNGKSGVTMPQSALKAMISGTIFSVSENQARPIQTGCLMEVTEDSVTMVAVDSFRLARRTWHTQNAANHTLKFVVPAAGLKEIERILEDSDEPVTFTLGDKHILFSIGDALLVSRVLEGEFIDWRRVVPTNCGTVLTANVAELTSSIERVSLIISEKVKSPVRCVFGDNMADFRTANTIGSAHDTCSIAGNGGELEIGFNSRYLLDALRVIPSEEVTLELQNGLSLKPPRATMLDLLKDAGKDVIAVGKIYDIFDGEGVTEKIKTTGNTNGIAFTKALQTRDFEGLAFVNLVDFDMLYGHRRDVAGYAAAATEFDRFLADFLPGMREGDLLMITADHGCDPSYTKTTDHTREYVPYLVCGKGVKPGVDLGTRLCFGTIAQTVCEYLGVDASSLDGHSVLQEILK